MTYFRVGQLESASTPQRPFVEFSPHQDRASLMSIGSGSNRSRKRSTIRRKGRRRPGSRKTKIKVVNGKVSLKVGGFPGIQRVVASQLVRFVPLNKLRSAAKQVLGAPPKRGKRVKRGRKQKRQGRHH